MKLVLCAVLAAALLGTGSSLRADDSNGMFLVFPYGTGRWEDCVEGTFGDHYAMKILYVCPPVDFVRGFECQIRYHASDNLSVISATFPVPAIDVGDKLPGLYPEYNFIVGYGEPVPTSDFTVLADIDIHYLCQGSLYLTFGASSPSSGDGTSPLIMLDDFSLLQPDKFNNWAGIVDPATGECSPVITSLDAVPCYLPISDEGVSWGGVKCLYK